MKRQLPLIITFLTGLAVLVAFFWPQQHAVSDTMQDWVIVIGAFAIILGIFNVLFLNFKRVATLHPNWFYSLVLIASLLVTAFIGVMMGIEDGPRTMLGTPQGQWFNWLTNNLYFQLNSTMFSLLAFFIASAAFRAFRAKSVEATLLLGAAFIVMLGRVPLGDFLWNHSVGALWAGAPEWFKLSAFSSWIMDVPNTAGQRAILIGAGLGAVAISLKILLGVERSYLGGDE